MYQLARKIVLISSLLTLCEHSLAADNRPVETKSPHHATQSPPSLLNLSVNGSFDCIYNFNFDKGKSQDCLNISRLSLSVERQFDRVYAGIGLNPFGTPLSSHEFRPRVDPIPSNKDLYLGVFDEYKVIWSPRPHLEIGIESFSGSAIYPSVSPLAMSNPFMETGWKQTALTVTYNLIALPEMKVRFAGGNGEGENGLNLDTQQFFGFDISALIFPGLKGHLGISLDGNSSGSEENNWKVEFLKTNCGLNDVSIDKNRSPLGYSTQRMSLGFILNGIWPGSEGMHLGFGYQKNILSDLNKRQRSDIAVEELKLCPRIDLNSLFVEGEADDSETANTVQRTIYNLDLVFSNESYFLAGNYSLKEIDTGSVQLFDLCIENADYKCQLSENKLTNNLKIDSFTIGGGIYLSKTSSFSLEYQIQNFDKLYVLANFPDRKGSISKSRDILDARFTVSLH